MRRSATLNADRSNAILVCHALSASAHAAGKYTDDRDEKPGWWDGLIGYGKAIDLEQYFVVCVNLPGSPFGTTAPKSIDPATGKPYGSRYPWPTIEDMVESQKLVLEHLGITHLRAIAGGSLGGMQVLMWAAMYPEFADSIIAMASGAAVPVTGIAWHILGRKIIETDQRFNGGDYYDDPDPLRGLQVARMLGHMTYLSHECAAAQVRTPPPRRHAPVRDRLVLRVSGQEVRRALRRELVHPRAGGDGRDGSRGTVRRPAAGVRALARPHAARVVRYGLAVPAGGERTRRRGDARARNARRPRRDRVGERTRHVPDRLPT